MKKSYTIAITCMVIIVGLAVWYKNTTILQISGLAQTGCCYQPTFGPSLFNNKWSKNNNVKIRIHSGFTDSERQSILAAFNHWNDNKTLNCTNVTFDTTNFVIADAQASSEAEVILSYWVVFKPEIYEYAMAVTNPTSRPSASTAIYGQLRDPEGDPDNDNPAWLTGLMSHEIGHTFNLDNSSCQGRLMGITRNIDRVISECDNAVIRELYCPTPTPTPTPTSYPTPSDECFQPMNNFQGNACPMNFTADSTGYYCCSTSTRDGGGGVLTNTGSGCSNGSFTIINFTTIGTDGYGTLGTCATICGDMCVRNGGVCNGGICQTKIFSPVLVDIAGDGFNMTSAENGVQFDIDIDSFKQQISWTSAGSDDAWLALDLNNNGTIDDGKELFGNFTNQSNPPDGEALNGFLALGEYDKIANGGNNDGVINSQDPVFTYLRLWRDANHNGISESSETHTLTELGIAEFDLDYKESKRTDEFGNQFKYRAKVRDERGAQAGRWAWDVFLVTTP